MAALLNKIKTDQLAARRARDSVAASLLTTLYSEAATIGLNLGKRATTDREVIAVVKKFIKNIDECIAVVADPTTQLAEKKILEGYLPKQLTEQEITDIVSNILSGIVCPTKKDMGIVMSTLKAMHSGCYDGALANKIVNSLLS